MLIDITDFRSTQEALRESQDRFRRYFELGLIGMAITSPTQGILEVNDELCRILGYERHELLQKAWPELTHPGDLAADITQFQRVMAGEFDGYTLDKRWIRKDGRIIDSIMSAKCLRRSDGSVDYFVGLVQDITERKRGEAETADLKNALASELETMTRLHEFSIRLLSSTQSQPFLEDALLEVMSIQHADFGDLEIYNPEKECLEIVVQRGFQREFLEYFAEVRDEGATCGRATKLRERIIVEDVSTDPGFEPHRAVAAAAGFRGVQSTPLFSASGEVLGVLSTHFRDPHRPSEYELRLTDLYCGHAAKIIERERNQAAFLSYQQELRALTARLVEAQEMQSKHLARELHDALSQKLAVLGMEIAALAQRPPVSFEALSSRLVQFTERIGELSKDIHRISRQLHPAVLEDLGLEAALRNECLVFSEQHGIPLEFEADSIPRKVPDEIALCLYRVAQECLRNVASHANAVSVRVALHAGADWLSLEIADAGTGFDPNGIRGRRGLGLISMDERVRQVRGSFSVQSRPSDGTRVNARVPFGVS